MMNERFRQLAEQAGLVKILEEHASEYGGGTFENTPYPELEKFAELIVGECASVCENSNYEFGTIFTKMIKEHFGVEE